jgi:hypothetical protein
MMIPFAIAAVAFWFSALGGGFYFARRYVRAAEARGDREAALSELRARVQTLEDALDGTQRDVQRLEAAQEFTTRLLADRSEPK